MDDLTAGAAGDVGAAERSGPRVSRRRAVLPTVALALVLVAGCGEGNTDPDVADIGSAGSQQFATSTLVPTASAALMSPAFVDGGPIPAEQVCAAQGGGNVSPALMWSGLPPATTSLALVMDDPDAPVPGGFVHWVLVDIDPASGGIGAGAVVGQAGANSAGDLTYLGPCPPAGAPHTYVFTLYAFAESPDWPPEPTREDVLAAVGSATSGAIDQIVLTGTYGNDG